MNTRPLSSSLGSLCLPAITLLASLSVGFAQAQVLVPVQGVCTAPENAVGSIDWPAQCVYGTGLDHIEVPDNGGGKIWASVSIPGMALTCNPNPIGPRYDAGRIPAFVRLQSGNRSVVVRMDMAVVFQNTEATPAGGDDQTIDTEIISMSLSLPQGGHPAFDSLSLIAQPGGTGLTRLTRLPTGNFNVDSFFDICYQIDFVGAPGGALEGVSANADVDMHLRQSLQCVDGVCYEPLGNATTSNRNGELVVGNIGSSGQDGVSLSVRGHGFGDPPDDLCTVVRRPGRLVANGGPGGLIGDNEALAMFPFPPPPPDFTLPPQSIVCTNTGGIVSAVCSSGALQASEWVVEVWDGNALVSTVVTPDASSCFTIPASLFEPSELRVSTKPKGNVPAKYNPGKGGRMSTSMTFPGAVEFTLAGAATPVVGDRVVVSPRDPQVLPGRVNRLDLTLTSFDPDPDDLCVVGVGLSASGLDHSGLGSGAMSTRGGHLVVSNIGSSGEDGVSIDLGGDGPPYLRLPYEADLSPIDVESSGGSFFVRSVDVAGGNVATAEYRGGGGSGGSIWVTYNTASPVCRVAVLNNGVHVGELDVPLNPTGDTLVCSVGTDAIGNSPLLTGCGKLRLGWPWDLSCLVEEFDRPVSITPVGGGTSLVGDEIQLLAPGATPAEVESIRSIQLRASGIPEIEICSEAAGPGLPPIPVVDDTFVLPHIFDTFGQLQATVDTYYTYDPDTGEAVCANSTIKDVVLQSSNGGIDIYSATLELRVRGVGGSSLGERILLLPGTLEVQPGPNNFAGQDVQWQQQFVRRGVFVLPAGDPDFAVLEVRAGSQYGLPSPGQTTLTRLPEGNFQVDSFFDVFTELSFQGAPGGPLDRVAVTRAPRQVVHGLVKADLTFAGLAHTSVDGAKLSLDAGGRLVVSNIGSSGCDGVSIDLGGAEGFDMVFPELDPPILAPGGTIHFDEYGDGFELPAGTLLGSCTSTNNADSFFDIFYDFTSVSPSSTTIAVYDGGVLVASAPVAAASANLEVHDASGTGLPRFRSVGKLPGLSATPCKRIRWWDRGQIFVPGLPGPVLGDEVRMLAHGVGFESISRFELRASDVVDHCIVIEEELPCYFGRQLTGSGQVQLSPFGVEEEGVGGIEIDNIGSSGQDGVRFIPPPSAILTGRRQLWPMSGNLNENGIVFDGPGSRLTLEACGTINGVPGTSYGTLDACWDGEKVVLKGDWSARGTTLGDVVVIRELDKSSTKVAEATSVGMGSLCSFEYRQEFGPTQGGRIHRFSAVPELYEPPHNEVECSYTLRFNGDVKITLPGQAPVWGNRIDVRLVNPTHVSEDIDCLRVTGVGLKPFVVTGVGTGPFHGHGLVNTTLGSAQIEEASPGNNGSLVVSNIGSSGLDGVSIDLDVAEGVWQTIAPLDLASVGGSLRVGVGETCDGLDDDCDGDVDYSVALDHLPGPVYVRDLCLETGSGGSHGGNGAVIGIDRNGQFTGSSEIRRASPPPPGGYGPLGTLEPVSGGGGGGGRVVAYGLLPPTIIEGVGYVGECIAYEFEEPMVFTPADGGPPMTCEILRVCPDLLAQPVLSESRELRVGGGWWPQLQIDSTELLHLEKTSHTALGVAQMSAQNGQLVVSNIGSSGLDGVRVGGVRKWTLEVRVNRIDMAIVAPPPGGGGPFPELQIDAAGLLNGVPGTLGSSSIALGSTTTVLPIQADFAALGAPEVRVVPCLDGVCHTDFDFKTPSGGTVCHVIADPGNPPGVIGCGKLREQPIPGGFEPPCFFWDFDIPVEIVPPGGAAGTGVLADRVLILAHGGPGSWDTEILSMDLHSSGPPLVLLPPAQPDSFFDVWTEIYFTPTEIIALDAADYRLDIDGDGIDEVDEFLRGLNPRVHDGAGTGPDLSSVLIRGQQGAPDQEFMLYSYQRDPDIVGAEVTMQSSINLQDFIDDPELWDLIELESLANGNLKYTWQRTVPVSANQRLFHKHRGYVTILK